VITAIVPCYNEEEYIPSCVDSLLAQSIPIDEIIIVDDGSSERTKKVLREESSKSEKIRVIYNERNLGKPRSLNIALRESKGDVVCVVDADCRPQEDWVERGLKKLENYDVVSGPYINPRDTAVRIANQLVDDFFISLGRGATAAKITGGNIIARKSVLKGVGGFDESDLRGEDYNLSVALERGGYEVYYGKDVAMPSLGEPKTLSEVFRQRLTWGASLRYSAKRYGLTKGTIARFLYVILFLAGFIFPVLFIPVLLPLALIFLFGLVNFRKYSPAGILLSPLVAFIRVVSTFLGFLAGEPGKWRQIK
jgi:cellulose synthase/poly-beta-1,6-N-acetylglucosamine synthase-like glycosyltransferase